MIHFVARIALAALLLIPLASIAQGDGTLDLDFGQNGEVLVSTPESEGFSRFVVLDDDRIVSVQGALFDNSQGGEYYTVLRMFTQDGQVDDSFGTNGQALFDLGITPLGLTLDNQDRLMLIGESATSSSLLSLNRFEVSGMLDDSFANDGTWLENESIGLYGSFDMVACATDGTIKVGGRYDTPVDDYPSFVFSLTESGHVDSLFGTNGLAPIFQNETLLKMGDILEGAEGALYVTAMVDFPSVDTPTALAITALEANGALDDSFGDGGQTLFPLEGAGTAAHFLASTLVADGIVIATSSGANNDQILVKYTYEGQLDPTFGQGGSISYPMAGEQSCTGIITAEDGALVIGGMTSPISETYQYLATGVGSDGQLDISFGDEGRYVHPSPPSFRAPQDTHFQSDGKILLGGGGAPFLSAQLDLSIIRLHYQTPNSLTERKDISALSIYPNPSIGTLSISANEVTRSISLTDATGRLVLTRHDYSGDVLDLSHLPAGLYHISAHLASGKVSSASWVKE